MISDVLCQKCKQPQLVDRAGGPDWCPTCADRRLAVMKNVIDRDTRENGRLEEIVASDSPILSTPDRYLIVEWAGPIAHNVCTARTVGIARLFVQNEVNDPEVTTYPSTISTTMAGRSGMSSSTSRGPFVSGTEVDALPQGGMVRSDIVEVIIK